MLSVLPIALLAVSTLVSAGNVVVNPNKPPVRTEPGQIGYNDCYRRKDSPSAKCQTLYINSLTDFCLWAPHKKSTVGNAEATVVSYCTAAGHGSRLMPKGTIKGAHYIRTPHYIQITGVGDFTKLNIPKGDDGGELDPHGADGTGNPKGGIVIANVDGRKVQIQEWTEFISYNEFCIRACLPGKDAKRWCEHIYDVMGCFWSVDECTLTDLRVKWLTSAPAIRRRLVCRNEPGNYKSGAFDTCAADDTILPMGEYYVKGKNGQKSVSTFRQGQAKTPAPHPAGKSSKCKAIKTISPASYPK